MLNTFVIVWRESLEALLVIGVLAAWIARQPAPGPLRRQLALGVAAGVGLAAALGVAALLVRGARGLATRRLMQASEWLLLVIGGALVVAAADQAIALDLLAPGWDPLWDTSAWLDDGRGLGRVLADFAGYRARPCSTGLLAWAGWWGLALALRARAGRPARALANGAPVVG